MIESRVDVNGDIASINRGEAFRRGDTYVIRGRTYRLEPGGRVYPLSGLGVHQLSRSAFKALGVYNTLGQTPRSEEILDEIGADGEERASARRVWEAEHGR